jgi:uncharacterized protein (DUF1330 family)
MSKGYWIVGVDVTDPKTYKSYLEANTEVFAKYGAKFLVRGGQRQMVEGCGRERNVVIEFDSYQMAVDCYFSAEYQAAKSIRVAASKGNVMIIEGYDDSQPSD